MGLPRYSSQPASAVGVTRDSSRACAETLESEALSIPQDTNSAGRPSREVTVNSFKCSVKRQTCASMHCHKAHVVRHAFPHTPSSAQQSKHKHTCDNTQHTAEAASAEPPRCVIRPFSNGWHCFSPHQGQQWKSVEHDYETSRLRMYSM